MNKSEERIVVAQEEVFEFGTNEGNSVRVWCSWLTASAEVNNGSETANDLTKKWEDEWLKALEAYVESILLHDYQARVWPEEMWISRKSVQTFEANAGE